MRSVASSLMFSALILSSCVALAQGDPVAWEKSYPISAQPTLTVSVGDSQLNIHPCASCQAVHVRVTTHNTDLSRYVLEESQSGDTVNFSLKEKMMLGLHMTHNAYVHVDVETPARLTLDARCSDGNLTAADLQGSLSFHTSDGNQDLQRMSGDLKLRSSDGQLRLQDGKGTLEATTSDGNMNIDGSFTSLQLRSSDGSMKVALAEGSRLSADSAIEGHDGSVSIVLPKSFPAVLDVSAHDGNIQSTVPLVVDGFNSKDTSGHSIRGKVDGGGSLLTIRTSDGSVHLTTL